MANTLVVDDSSVAALNYFDLSFAAPIYDSCFMILSAQLSNPHPPL